MVTVSNINTRVP